MPGPYWITRVSAAAATAINTSQSLSNDLTASSAGAITVPGGLAQNVIAAYTATVNVSALTVTAVGSSFTMRIVGNGLSAGQHDFALGGFTSLQTTPSMTSAFFSVTKALALTGAAIAVIATNQFSVTVAQSGGVSVGTWSAAASFCFV